MHNTYKNLLNDAIGDGYDHFIDLPRQRQLQIAITHAKDFVSLSAFDDIYIWHNVILIMQKTFKQEHLEAFRTDFIETLADLIQADMNDLISLNGADPMYLTSDL